MAFGFGEHGQRPLLGGAVDAVARFTQDPLFELVIAIDQSTKLRRGKKFLLRYLTPGLHAPFLFWIPDRAR